MWRRALIARYRTTRTDSTALRIRIAFLVMRDRWDRMRALCTFRTEAPRGGKP